MLAPILARYGLEEKNCLVTVFGNGLINHTWKIVSGRNEFLLQQINQQVFPEPPDIMTNLSLLSAYLNSRNPDYLFVAPVHTTEGQNYVLDREKNYYRLFPFIANSYSPDTVSTPQMAYEASRQFGKFARLLSGFDPALLRITLPDFHNLALRQQQFESALQCGNKKRISDSAGSIRFLQEQKKIVDEYEKIKKNASFKIRTVHHDAKINNVLFDRGDHRGLCVVDLDTVMPGYYISDVGDMLRTYICPVGEEEPDFNRIVIREEYFSEIVRGYLGEMQSELSEYEKQYFVYAGKFAIFMQALRFLTDYIKDDVYYFIKYEKQNQVRADNQITLLKRYNEKEDLLNTILQSFLKNNPI
jgi:thiamine kinase-like enzyme